MHYVGCPSLLQNELGNVCYPSILTLYYVLGQNLWYIASTMPKHLPTEIVSIIVRYLVWELTRCERTSKLELVKVKFEKGLANASRAYREVYMIEWFRHLTLHGVDDWKFARDHNIAALVRVLNLKANALSSHAALKNLDFSRCELIHTITLDCHNDVGTSVSLGIKGQWSYKKIIPNLPKKLKSLTILNAHGPDLQVIQKAIKQCNTLESLTLGRCTKFNCPDLCEFWKSFPNDHDSYFSGKGVDGYANALGTELQGLPNLKSIFVNVYLTNTKYLNETNPAPEPTAPVHTPTTELITVATKRSSSSQAPVVPVPAQAPTHSNQTQAEQKCDDQKDTEEAEKLAASTLFSCHSALQTVGFISYWSKGHLGWSIRKREDENKSQSPGPGGKVDGTPCQELVQSI
ncbi:unnamed protein product [Rhizoctonia solani]|uniref:Uncharacterized protein n=1 Tax=Rhizoctonia solani TaxID=456999 RepID=A0A8H3E0A0_9AGAM|nr:unnamed protein product [Rhizoctonia solani]